MGLTIHQFIHLFTKRLPGNDYNDSDVTMINHVTCIPGTISFKSDDSKLISSSWAKVPNAFIGAELERDKHSGYYNHYQSQT